MSTEAANPRNWPSSPPSTFLFCRFAPVASIDGELLIEMPPGRVRDFTVEISEAMPYRSGWFTLVVGDAVVPLNILAAHLTRRGYSSYVEEGGPVRVVGILESAPLRVLAALGSYPRPVSASDNFVLPQYADIRELRTVPLNGKVVFDRKTNTPGEAGGPRR